MTMNPRALLLAVAALLAYVAGAHLAPLLLTVAALAIAGTVLVLLERIAATVIQTGWGCIPMRRAWS